MGVKSVGSTDKTPAQMFVESVQNKNSNQNEKQKKNTRANMQISDELSFMRPETPYEGDKKLAMIMNKYNAGEELSAEELRYLAEHSPETAQKARQMMAERKQIEAMMKAAKTKSQAMLSAAMVMTNTNESTDNPIEANMRLKHLRNAVNEYVKTSEFKAKADLEIELAKNPADKVYKEQEKREEEIAESIRVAENGAEDGGEVYSADKAAGVEKDDMHVEAEVEMAAEAKAAVETLEKTDTEKEIDKQKEEKIKKYRRQHFMNGMDFKI